MWYKILTERRYFVRQGAKIFSRWFFQPFGDKKDTGGAELHPICWTVYNYILYNYSNHHTSGEHGIERKTPHATHHTYASRAVKEGLPPEMLQKILGHADYSTTANIYTHIDAQTLVDAVTNTLLTNKKWAKKRKTLETKWFQGFRMPKSSMTVRKQGKETWKGVWNRWTGIWLSFSTDI